MVKKIHYILTLTAEQDFRQAKAWSLSRWGKKLTHKYFKDLHNGAEYVAAYQSSLQNKDYITGDTGLNVYAVREHYIVYVSTSPTEIIIVALIRQIRDVPTILKANHFVFKRELKEILGKYT